MTQESVPVPVDIQPPPSASSADIIHDLMQRKRDAVKNRMKFHLTETDCKLICTHGIDKYYAHGQVIAEEGQPIQTVYRIKHGRVCLVKQGQRLYNLSQGFFIGEGMFIHNEDEYDDYFGASLVANGPVTITEVNIPFVRQLLEADKVLSYKLYRSIAAKLAALSLSILGSVAVEEYIPSPKSEHEAVHLRDAKSDSQTSLSSVTSADSQGSLISDLQAAPTSVIVTEEMVKDSSHRATKTKITRLKSKISHKEKVPFKEYHMESEHHIPVTCQMTSQKIILMTGAAGIKAKRKIKYNKILDIRQTAKTAAMIIYGVQAKTLYFRTEDDMHEFFGIVNSLITTENKQHFNTTIASHTVSPTHLVGQPQVASPLPAEQAAQDKAAIQQLAVQQTLKKGDLVVAEGDLYQRIYTIVSGELHMKKRGRDIVTMRDGEVFGVMTLFHLRPSMLDVEVVSETATLLVIPGYKVTELATTNFPLAVRLHKNAAQLIYSQVGQLLKSQGEVVQQFSDNNVIV